MIKLPGATPSGSVDRPVTTQSILATALDLCGIDYDGEYLSSASLLPLWNGSDENLEDPPIISTGLKFYENRESVLFGNLKYIRSMVTGREELFDLKIDPGEQISIAHQFPDLTAQALDLSESHRKNVTRLRDHYGLVDEQGSRVELDEQTKEKLRSLGYIH